MSIKNYFVTEQPAGKANAESVAGTTSRDGIPLKPMASLTDSKPALPWTTNKEASGSGTDVLSSLSRTNSLHPEGDFRNGSQEAIRDIKSEVTVNWLHSKQEERIWTTGEPGEGVVLKKAKGRYVCCPSELQYDGSHFYQMIAQLNVRVCVSHSSAGLRTHWLIAYRWP
jgi:hypothetical protein